MKQFIFKNISTYFNYKKKIYLKIVIKEIIQTLSNTI